MEAELHSQWSGRGSMGSGVGCRWQGPTLMNVSFLSAGASPCCRSDHESNGNSVSTAASWTSLEQYPSLLPHSQKRKPSDGVGDLWHFTSDQTWCEIWKLTVSMPPLSLHQEVTGHCRQWLHLALFLSHSSPQPCGDQALSCSRLLLVMWNEGFQADPFPNFLHFTNKLIPSAQHRP